MTARIPDPLVADYDDAPGRPTGVPIARLLRAAGAFLTILMAGSIASLLALGINVAPDVYLVCTVFSVASILLIMLFWSEEVAWRGGWLGGVTIVVVSLLTWIAELLLSVFILAAGLVIARI